VNEERPFFKRKTMGSRIYTKAAKENKEDIKGALILEMIGYYSEAPGSQRHFPGLNFAYPTKGNFIGVIGNPGSRGLLKKTVASFRRAVKFPIEWMVAPKIVVGVDFSDNWSFWKEGYRALMITDTAFYRNPHYHKASDTYETLDYERMSCVVKGITASLRAIAR
jgi:Zn-dependent M28 family amino/carboxypeptidase